MNLGFSLQIMAPYEMSNLDLLCVKFDTARTSKGRARVIRRMIKLGRDGVEELCNRAMTERVVIRDEILALLARYARRTEPTLHELAEVEGNRGAALALEEIASLEGGSFRRVASG